MQPIRSVVLLIALALPLAAAAGQTLTIPKKTEFAKELLGVLLARLGDEREVSVAMDNAYCCRLLLKDLPDNLTTYRIMAVAVGRDDRFGSGPVIVAGVEAVSHIAVQFGGGGEGFGIGVQVIRAGGVGTVDGREVGDAQRHVETLAEPGGQMLLLVGAYLGDTPAGNARLRTAIDTARAIANRRSP